MNEQQIYVTFLLCVLGFASVAGGIGQNLATACDTQVCACYLLWDVTSLFQPSGQQQRLF